MKYSEVCVDLWPDNPQSPAFTVSLCVDDTVLLGDTQNNRLVPMPLAVLKEIIRQVEEWNPPDVYPLVDAEEGRF